MYARFKWRLSYVQLKGWCSHPPVRSSPGENDAFVRLIFQVRVTTYSSRDATLVLKAEKIAAIGTSICEAGMSTVILYITSVLSAPNFKHQRSIRVGWEGTDGQKEGSHKLHPCRQTCCSNSKNNFRYCLVCANRNKMESHELPPCRDCLKKPADGAICQAPIRMPFGKRTQPPAVAFGGNEG